MKRFSILLCLLPALAFGQASVASSQPPSAGDQKVTTNEGPRDVASIKDFGARCDGVTDDTQAIIKAINAVCGGVGRGPSWPGRGTVVIPDGTCMITPNQTYFTTFTAYSNCTIQGGGKTSILKVVNNAGNYNTLFGNPNLAPVSNIRFRDFHIDQNAAGQLSTAGCTPNCHCPNGAPDCGTPNCPNSCTDVGITNGCKNVSGFCAQMVIQLWGQVTGVTVSNMVFDATGGWVVNVQNGNQNSPIRGNISNNTVNFRKVRSTDNASAGASACTGSTDAVRCTASYDATAPWVGLCPDGTPAPLDACNFSYDQSVFYFEGEDVLLKDNAVLANAAAPPKWTPNTGYVNGQFVQNGGNIYRVAVPAWRPGPQTYTEGQVVTTAAINSFNMGICMQAGSSGTAGATQPVCPGVPIGDCTASDGNITWTYQPTCGTSATSGGPTGTGNGIVDGTLTWNYTTNVFDRGSAATSAFEIHGGRYTITGNVVKNYGVFLNAVVSTLKVPEITPNDWIVTNNKATCGGAITLVALSNADGLAISRAVRNVNVSGNTITVCNADRQLSNDANGQFGWIGAGGDTGTTQDAIYENITIANNDIAFQMPDDRNNMFYHYNSAIQLGGHISSCPSIICPSRSSWKKLVIQDNTIRNSPNDGIFLDICKTVPVAVASLSRAASGIVTATVPADLTSTCTDGRGRSACCLATTGSGHLFLPGQTVYLTPGERNFPAGYKVITEIGQTTPSLTFSYKEAPGVTATSRSVQNFQATGSEIKIANNVIVDSGHSIVGTAQGAGAGAKRAAIQLVDGPFLNVDLEQNHITDTSNTSTLNGLQGIDLQTAAGSKSVRLKKNEFTTFGTGKLAAPAGPLNGVVDAGELVNAQAVSIGADTYTPDPTRFSRHVLTLTSTAATTIANPSPYGIAGQKLEITVRNKSGGKLKLRWGTAYKHAFRNPANNKSATVVFTYNGRRWIQTALTSCAVANC